MMQKGEKVKQKRHLIKRKTKTPAMFDFSEEKLKDEILLEAKNYVWQRARRS